MGVQFASANAVDKLTIKIGYFGWPTSDYVEKAVFKASELYNMGTVKADYTYWDGGSRVAIDSSIGVPLSTILSAAGIDQSSIAQMDFWTADSGNGAFTSFTWQQLLGTKRYYFRDLAACFEYQEDEPDVPDTPEKPDKPDEPEKPDTPDEPEKPDTPDKPDIPEEPEEPQTKVEAATRMAEPAAKASSDSGRVVLNKDKAWKKAKRVEAMMALEETWVWYEVGTHDSKGTENYGTANRFRLNFGQAAPDEKRTFNSAKQVHTIYVMFSGKPKLTSKETNIKGKVGSSHQLKVSAAAADKSLKNKIESKVVWSSSNSDIVSVDANGKLTFNKDGTATIYAKSGGAIKEFKITVGDQNSGEGTGEGTGDGKGTNPDAKDEGTKKKAETVRVERGPGVYVLSEEAANRLRLAISKQANAEEASMSTHQEEMDDDAEQLTVKKQVNGMAVALISINGALALGGAAFGLLRYRKQRWG